MFVCGWCGLIITNVEGFVLCTGGKMAQLRCRDGVKVLWCRSRLVWLVFEDFIPTCALRLTNFFVTCFCCFFFVVV